jgi:hypothetical protein
MTKQEKYLIKVKEKHGGRYDLSRLNYADAKTSIIIGCHIHGFFEKNPSEFLRDNGCKKCSNNAKKLSWDDVKTELISIWGDECDYDVGEYKGMKTLMSVRCIHHDYVYQISPANHKVHKGCPKCREENYGSWLKLTKEEFLVRARNIHGDLYDYPDEYNGYLHKMNIWCKEHNQMFSQTGKNHLAGSGCPACGRKSIGRLNSTEESDFFTSCSKTHNNKFSYVVGSYKGMDKTIDIPCPYHGIFTVIAGNHRKGTAGCPDCAYVKSEGFEKEIVTYIRDELGVECKKSKSLMGNGQEVDAYIENKNLAFEMDGVYFHSELMGKDENYHLNKTELCNAAGVKLFHIFEDDWYDKKDIVKSFIRNKLADKHEQVSDYVFRMGKEENFVKENSLLEDYFWASNISIIKDEVILYSISLNWEGNVIDLIANKNYKLSNIGFYILVDHYRVSRTLPFDIKLNRRFFEDLGFGGDVSYIPPQEWYFKRSRVKRFTKKQLCKIILGKEDPSMEEINDAGYYRIWDCGYKIITKTP